MSEEELKYKILKLDDNQTGILFYNRGSLTNEMRDNITKWAQTLKDKNFNILLQECYDINQIRFVSLSNQEQKEMFI